MGKKFSKILTASSILAGVGMGAYMYLKKEGLISGDTVFPGKKLADKVSADAADKLGLERTYVDLSDVDEDDIEQPNLIRHTTIANFTISPKAEAAEEEAAEEEPATNKILEPSAAPKKEEKPEPSVSPQEEEDDSLTGDGIVDEPAPDAAPEPVVVEVPRAKTSDQDIKDESIDAEASEEKSEEPAPADGIEDDDQDLFIDGEGEGEEDDESEDEADDKTDSFEPGLGAPSIDASDSRTLGSVASEEFFNDEK